VLRGDVAPGDPGPTFNSFGANPQINDDGVVAFRATTLTTVNGANVRQSGIFLKDATGTHVLVLAAGTSTRTTRSRSARTWVAARRAGRCLSPRRRRSSRGRSASA